MTPEEMLAANNAAPIPAQRGLGGLLSRLNPFGQGGQSFRNTLAPVDPSQGVDPGFARAQQRLAAIRLAAGIAGGQGLAQGLSQGLEASQNQYQTAMQNAYKNALLKKQAEERKAALDHSLALDKQRQSNWEAERKAQSEDRAARLEETRASREALAQYRKDTIDARKNKVSLPAPPSGYRYSANGDLEFVPGGPADPARKNDMLRPVPAAIAQGVASNNQELKKLDSAIAAVEKNPGAFGMKNYAPDALVQRMDKEGVDPRAKVGDIGSMIIHDRSGAAVSAMEFPRLRPFIPQSTDHPDVVVTKLKNLRNTIAAMQDEIQSVFTPETGYRPLQTDQPNQSPTATATGPNGEKIGLINGQWVPLNGN